MARSPHPGRSPSFIKPMAARVVDRLPEGNDWMYEVKFDGYRALLLKNGNQVQIRSRNQKDLTGTYPSVTAAGLRLRADQAVLDGEIVAVDAIGRPSFQALQHRTAHPGHTIVFYAFDLLHLAGEDLTRTPLADRRAKLPQVVNGSGVLLSIELPGTAQQVIDAVQSLGLEGVIAKRKSSRYDAAQRNNPWVKLKLDRQQEFVVGGYRPGPNGIDALLVGYYAGKALLFAGKVRAGFTPHLRREVFVGGGASSHRPLSIRGPSERQDVALGRGSDRRADARDAMVEADARHTDPLRGMDRRRSPPPRRLSWTSSRQESRENPARNMTFAPATSIALPIDSEQLSDRLIQCLSTIRLLVALR